MNYLNNCSLPSLLVFVKTLPRGSSNKQKMKVVRMWGREDRKSQEFQAVVDKIVSKAKNHMENKAPREQLICEKLKT